MKSSYSILCIDDNLDSLNRNKSYFKDLNTDVGIDVNYYDIDAKAQHDEIDKRAYFLRLCSDIKVAFDNGSYDLMLIDLHLNNEVEGHELIEIIRDNHTLYRPVIFYSAGSPQTDERALEQLSAAAQANGVYGKNILITPRRKINDILAKIAEEMHAEEHKINNVRGFLMDSSSEIEANFLDILKIDFIWESVDSKDLSMLEKYIKNSIFKKEIKDLLRNYNVIKRKTLVEIRQELTGDAKKITTKSKVRILLKILKKLGETDRRTVIHEYIENENFCLSTMRNKYAHCKATELEGDHGYEVFVNIRKESKRQRANIDSILEKYNK